MFIIKKKYLIIMSKKLYFNKTYDNNYLKKYMINVIILMTIKNTYAVSSIPSIFLSW